jgi:hypothetical protein
MLNDAKKSLTKQYFANRKKWILFCFGKRKNEKVQDVKRAHPTLPPLQHELVKP